MKDKKPKNPNDVKHIRNTELGNKMPIVDIYTSMFCVDELENYDTDYYDCSNVVSDK